MKKVLLYSFLVVIMAIGFNGCGGASKIKDAVSNNDFHTLNMELKKDNSKENIAKALSASIRYDRLEMYEKIMKEQNLNFESRIVKGGLYTALFHSNANFVKYFLKNGVDINYIGFNNTSPLHTAVHYSSLDLIKYMVRNGARLDIRTGNEMTGINGDYYNNNTPLDLALKILPHSNDKYQPNYIQVVNYLKNEAPKDRKHYIDKQVEKERLVVLKKQEKDQKAKVVEFESNNDLKGLKNYTDQYPRSVYFISNPTYRLALTGPKGMKVGDIRKLLNDGKSELIVISLIKRVKEPYKEYTIEEIDILLNMGLTDRVVSAMIDVTTKILENEERRKVQELLLAEQRKIAKSKTNTKVIYQNSSSSGDSNSVGQKVQNELIKQGVGKLLDNLF